MNLWFPCALSLRLVSSNHRSIIDWIFWWFNITSSLEDFSALDSLMALIFWEIWKARNRLIFDKTLGSCSLVISNALQQLSTFKEAFRSSSAPIRQVDTRNVIWIPPAEDFVKLNTDAAFAPSTNRSSSARILRDASGSFLFAWASPEISSSDVALLEALAIRQGLLLVVNLGFSRLIVERECLDIITSVIHGSPPISCVALVDDIVSLAESFEFISFSHVLRSANCAADCLAKKGLSVILPMYFSSCPPWLSDIVTFDTSFNA